MSENVKEAEDGKSNAPSENGAIDLTEYCTNCKKDIASKNFVLHEVHCKRNIVLCTRCNEPYPRTQIDEHEKENHSLVPCPTCRKDVEKQDLDDHKTNACPKRPVPCPYCELVFPLNELRTHDDFCGSRTERCPTCDQYVMLRDDAAHKASNCFPPPPDPPRRPDARDDRETYEDAIPRFVDEGFYRRPALNYFDDEFVRDGSNAKFRDYVDVDERFGLDDSAFGYRGYDFDPYSLENDGAEDGNKLPCEFCEKLFDSDFLIQHESGCSFSDHFERKNLTKRDEERNDKSEKSLKPILSPPIATNDREKQKRSKVTTAHQNNQTFRQNDVTFGQNDVTFGRNDADSGRNNADSGRNNADSGRNNADSGRNNADSGRNNADFGRNNADSGRNNADSGRNNTDSCRNNADFGRNNADSGRNSADSGRSNADFGRNNADLGRNNADSGRNNADSVRNNADLGRNNADSGRNNADSGRNNADSGRNNADPGRDNTDGAKSAGELEGQLVKRSHESKIKNALREGGEKSTPGCRDDSSNDQKSTEQSVARKKDVKPPAVKIVKKEVGNSKTSEIADAESPGAVTESDMIPCEFCDKQMSIFNVMEHQKTCRWVRPNESYKHSNDYDPIDWISDDDDDYGSKDEPRRRGDPKKEGPKDFFGAGVTGERAVRKSAGGAGSDRMDWVDNVSSVTSSGRNNREQCKTKRQPKNTNNQEHGRRDEKSDQTQTRTVFENERRKETAKKAEAKRDSDRQLNEYRNERSQIYARSNERQRPDQRGGGSGGGRDDNRPREDELRRRMLENDDDDDDEDDVRGHMITPREQLGGGQNVRIQQYGGRTGQSRPGRGQYEGRQSQAGAWRGQNHERGRHDQSKGEGLPRPSRGQQAVDRGTGTPRGRGSGRGGQRNRYGGQNPRGWQGSRESEPGQRRTPPTGRSDETTRTERGQDEARNGRGRRRGHHLENSEERDEY